MRRGNPRVNADAKLTPSAWMGPRQVIDFTELTSGTPAPIGSETPRRSTFEARLIDLSEVTPVAVERRDLAVDPRPIDLARKLHQLVLHVDDLIEPGPEQIA